MKVHGFNWDEGNVEKCQMHGVSIEEIESLFHNHPYVGMNYNHTTTEERLSAVGITKNGKYAFVVFTFRNVQDEMLIRPISARYMHKKEIDHYEKQIKS